MGKEALKFPKKIGKMLGNSPKNTHRGTVPLILNEKIHR